MEAMERINRAAEMLRSESGEAEIGVILGSGLGGFVEALQDAKAVPYSDIPGFPVSTVPGHASCWWRGTLHGRKVIMMQGRFHLYEGWSMEDIVLPVRVMRKLGVETLIVTNAAGGIRTGFSAGDLMAISDVFSMTGQNPLTGPNLEELGTRFPDMSEPFDRHLREIAGAVAQDMGFTLQEGVYAQMPGPSFETPAEIRMLKILGADAVGMSTVPEVIAARHCGMRVLGITCITNLAAGISKEPLSHEDVSRAAAMVKDRFTGLLDRVIEKI